MASLDAIDNVIPYIGGEEIKFVALSHNTIRGAAGGSILNAELMIAPGLVSSSRLFCFPKKSFLQFTKKITCFLIL